MTAGPRMAAGTWSVSDSRTRLGFAVGNLGRTVHGSLPCSWGDVVVDGSGAPVRASVGIDLRGVATGIARRDADLCRPRFLNAERHPTMTWTAERFTPDADGGWTAEGTLSLRGTSAPLTVTGRVESADPAGGWARLRGAAVLDRTAVGIRVPAVLVGRSVHITIDAWLSPVGAGRGIGGSSSVAADGTAAPHVRSGMVAPLTVL
ncbi:YceI family protein [Blastococcus sp. TF02A-26]|uniref:YceI family protein n=1 Tax=Blastococcus sp. TF02A-26 TaxID=2250577 RepID=UPI000DEAF2BA|nr:YceI family protein [Blastococcus sp. TF02A-26]RBY90612.1 YceI family protein [Blastococcus sp. TF02A-26]